MKKESSTKISSRPPIVIVMGHIDHGKSSLLDYIRKTNVTEREAGGITQHLGAYEAEWNKQKITFLDTPGHGAFSAMRSRGAKIADIAILVISAVEGVQEQTKEVLKSIKEAGLPFIVAANKMDKPGADLNRVKQTLAEVEIYTEGYGGTISCLPISAKTGDGIPELLDVVLLSTEMSELTANKDLPGEGVVIESHLDMKRGVTALLLVRDGSVKRNNFIVIDGAISPIRILENFAGKPIVEAPPSSPITLSQLSRLPSVGSRFITFEKKKEAEDYVKNINELSGDKNKVKKNEKGSIILIPTIIRADVFGSLEALERQMEALSSPEVGFKYLISGTGNITENDLKLAGGSPDPLIIGFNASPDRAANELSLKLSIPIHSFDIIYKATEWLEAEIEKRRPRIATEELLGKAKILKVFSRTKDKQIIGGQVTEGVANPGKQVRVMRNNFEIARGKVLELQHLKQNAKEVPVGKQFGTMIDSKLSIEAGDVLEFFDLVMK
ncbi:MAG: translation initiation factor IF-2 [Patescibacteria group bacterium]